MSQYQLCSDLGCGWFYLTNAADGVRLGLLISYGLEGIVSLDRYVREKEGKEDILYIASSDKKIFQRI